MSQVARAQAPRSAARAHDREAAARAVRPAGLRRPRRGTIPISAGRVAPAGPSGRAGQVGAGPAPGRAPSNLSASSRTTREAPPRVPGPAPHPGDPARSAPGRRGDGRGLGPRARPFSTPTTSSSPAPRPKSSRSDPEACRRPQGASLPLTPFCRYLLAPLPGTARLRVRHGVRPDGRGVAGPPPFACCDRPRQDCRSATDHDTIVTRP